MRRTGSVMTQYLWRLIQHISVFCIVMLCDRITKLWAITHCDSTISIFPGFSCSLLYNPGMIWGVSFSSYIQYSIWMIQAGVIVGLLGIAIWRIIQHANAWAEVLICAGGIANGIDRVLYPGVVDFIVIGSYPYVWPTFNIADIAIVVGVGMLVWRYSRSNVYA